MPAPPSLNKLYTYDPTSIPNLNLAKITRIVKVEVNSVDSAMYNPRNYCR